MAFKFKMIVFAAVVNYVQIFFLHINITFGPTLLTLNKLLIRSICRNLSSTKFSLEINVTTL